MNRKEFLTGMIGAVGVATVGVPLLAESYDCSCGLVTFVKQPEGHFAANYIIVNEQRQRFTYGLHRWHEHLHRGMAAAK